MNFSKANITGHIRHSHNHLAIWLWIFITGLQRLFKNGEFQENNKKNQLFKMHAFHESFIQRIKKKLHFWVCDEKSFPELLEQFSFKWVYAPNQSGNTTEAAPQRCGQEGMGKKPLLLSSFLGLCIPSHFHFCSCLWALLKSISDTWRGAELYNQRLSLREGSVGYFITSSLILQNGKLRPRNGDRLVHGHLMVTAFLIQYWGVRSQEFI